MSQNLMHYVASLHVGDSTLNKEHSFSYSTTRRLATPIHRSPKDSKTLCDSTIKMKINDRCDDKSKGCHAFLRVAEAAVPKFTAKCTSMDWAAIKIALKRDQKDAIIQAFLFVAPSPLRPTSFLQSRWMVQHLIFFVDNDLASEYILICLSVLQHLCIDCAAIWEKLQYSR